MGSCLGHPGGQTAGLPFLPHISRTGTGLVRLHWDFSPVAGPAQRCLASSSNLCRISHGGTAG